jgi:glycosyltransferase involved in cell wall biosynthesis
MRAGQNPAKFLERQVSKPERITVAILTHIPYLHGYYAESLDVLKLSLRSLRENTSLPYNLMVFDNASGEETRTFLYASYQTREIDYLILSKENIGKGKAWDIIFGAAPGEIIAYADSDVYFNQGWLQEAMQILETFPRVGMVTCRPMRTYTEGHTATIEWAQADPEARVDHGSYADWETIREHDVNLGQEEDAVRQRYEGTSDVLIQYRGIQAYAGAAHWQFLAYKRVLNQFIPLGIERPLGDDRKLDDALNQSKYLRLMTTEPLVRHLGNTLSNDLHGRTKESITPYGKRRSFARRLLDWSPLRRVMLGIYNRIFHWYFYH